MMGSRPCGGIHRQYEQLCDVCLAHKEVQAERKRAKQREARQARRTRQ